MIPPRHAPPVANLWTNPPSAICHSHARRTDASLEAQPKIGARPLRSFIPQADLPSAICHLPFSCTAHRRLAGSPAKNRPTACVKQALRDKLIAHKNYTHNYRQNIPEIRSWKWSQTAATQGKKAHR